MRGTGWRKSSLREATASYSDFYWYHFSSGRRRSHGAALQHSHVTGAQSHVSFGSIRVTAAVNWPRGNAGPRWGLPLILPQVRQSRAIRCTGCIAPLLISKWQRRQCVAMCTWGQGLIAFFQFSPRCVVTSRSHSPPNRYWSFLFKADAF